MTNPKVSVVMSVYNGETYLSRAIKSVLEQTFRDFEFIIINDGSTDGSLKIINSCKDSRIKLIDRANKGLTYSLNEGVKVAKGEYVARQDADDISVPTRLEKEVAMMEKDPQLGLVGSNYTVIDEKEKPLSTTNVFTHPDDLKLALVTCNQYGHGSTMMRKSVLDRVGPYDKSVGHVEDYDLWVRISRVAKLANIHEPLYLWRRNPTGVTYSNHDEQITQTFAIRDREFKNVLKNPSEYKFASFHPAWPGYFDKKSALYRDMAYLYKTNGRTGRAVLMQIAAIFCRPLYLRNYKRLIMLFNQNLFSRWGYEFL